MKFVDQAVIEVEAGTGGSGAEAFRRESGVPRGGPAGGDGGRGGDVVAVVDSALTTLLDYSYKRHYKAQRGAHGEGSNRTGRSGGVAVRRGARGRRSGRGGGGGERPLQDSDPAGTASLGARRRGGEPPVGA